LNAAVGTSHQFSDSTAGKLKANNNGDVQGLLKHEFSSHLSGIAKTSFNAKELSVGRGEPLKFGLAFEASF